MCVDESAVDNIVFLCSRYVLVPEKNTLHNPTPRFLPLDSPFARTPNPHHPPLFAAIMRRTSGIKVLECHAFICKREVAANALVRCCFHAYADSSYAKQVENGGSGSLYGTLNNERKDKEKVICRPFSIICVLSPNPHTISWWIVLVLVWKLAQWNCLLQLCTFRRTWHFLLPKGASLVVDPVGGNFPTLWDILRDPRAPGGHPRWGILLV